MPLTDNDLAALPKVELHIHLEGTVSASTAAELARGHGEDPVEVLEVEADGDGGFRYPAPFDDFDHFVRTFVATTEQLRTPDDLQRATAAFATDRHRQRVVWTEANLTALTMVQQGWDPAELWAAIAAGLGGASVGLVVDTRRDMGVDAGRRTVALVEEGLANGAPIVGLGLTGPETFIDVHEFAFLRDEADRLGLGLAVHAGETGDADQVGGALDIGADRIGHGVNSVNDDEVLTRLGREAAACEVCPSSNVTLQIVEDLAHHPLPRMAAAGVPVVIGSDDPPFFSTTLTDELRHAERLLDLDRSEHAQLQRRAARVAFLPRGRREELVTAIDRWERDGD